MHLTLEGGINYTETPKMWLRCVFLHSANMIHGVSADELPRPQESPTNFEKAHFARALKVLKVISDIPHWSIIRRIAYKLKHNEVESRLFRSCTKENAVQLI